MASSFKVQVLIGCRCITLVIIQAAIGYVHGRKHGRAAGGDLEMGDVGSSESPRTLSLEIRLMRREVESAKRMTERLIGVMEHLVAKMGGRDDGQDARQGEPPQMFRRRTSPLIQRQPPSAALHQKSL